MPLIPPPQALYGYVGQGAQIAVTTGIITSGLVAGMPPFPLLFLLSASLIYSPVVSAFEKA